MSAIPPAALKAISNRTHARRRAFERFGVDLSEADVGRIEGMIRRGDSPSDCVPLRPDRDYRNRLFYAVRHGEGDGDLWLPVVYDTATASVLSVLPDYTLDAYRAAIRPSARPPEPAPDPPPSAIPESGPPVGTILGTVALPAASVSAAYSGHAAVALAALPPDPPPLGDEPTVSEVDRARDMVNVRRAAVVAALAAIGGAKKDPLRPALVAEIERVNALGREVKRLRHRAYNRRNAVALAVADRHDPDCLLACAHAALLAMARRLSWDLEAGERPVIDAIGDYLSTRADAGAETRGEDEDERMSA